MKNEKKEYFRLDEILREEARKEKAKQAKGQKKATKEEVIEADDVIDASIEEDNKRVVMAEETIGTKTSGLKNAISNNKKTIFTALGSVALTAAIILTVQGCQRKDENNNKEEITTTTSITTEEEVIEIIEEESFETTVSTEKAIEETTKAIEETTIEPTNTTTKEEIKYVAPEDLVVTAATTQTTTTSSVQTASAFVSELEETTKATEETTMVIEPTVTTTSQAETTIEIQKEVKMSAEVKELLEKFSKPVEIKNLETKASILQDAAALSVGYIPEESAIDVIRVLHGDFIEHDEYKELSQNDITGVLNILTSIGSGYEIQMNASYLTGLIGEIPEYSYLPAEIFPEDSQELIRKFNELTKEYVKVLNDNQFVEVKVDYEEVTKNSIEKQQNYLDNYSTLSSGEDAVGIENFGRYLSLLEKLVQKDILTAEEEVEMENLSIQYSLYQTKQEAYKKYIKGVKELIQTPEYKNMEVSKLGIISNVFPAILSGVDTENYDLVKDQVNNYAEIITESVNNVRDTMVYIRKYNNSEVDQVKVLEEYVKQATEISEKESKTLDSIFTNSQELAKQFIKR